MADFDLEAVSPKELRKLLKSLAKGWFYDQHRDRLNDRQAKTIARMCQEGFDVLTGGLRPEIYTAIAGTSRANATRDLKDLIGHGGLNRTGEGRDTRDW